MKKIVLLAVVALLSVSTYAQKFAYIDSQGIMVEMEEYKGVENRLRDSAAAQEKMLGQYISFYKEKETALAAKGEDYPQDLYERDYNELVETQQLLQQKQMEAERKLQMDEQLILQSFLEKIRGAAAEVAKAKGYLYVFEKSQLIYAGGDDISDEVKKQLGITK